MKNDSPSQPLAWTAAFEENGETQSYNNIYFDFKRNADDNIDKQGRAFPGLRSQLAELRRRHFGAVFPGMADDADILALFQDTFFPHGLTQTYLICNLSLLADKPYLEIRPVLIGPRLEQLLPPGMTISLQGRLWDNKKDPNNPVFSAQNVVDHSDSNARPFEREVTALVFTQYVQPSRRQRNVLTCDFVASLPSISEKTKKRLEDWRAYLDWKERLIKANLVGLRYLQVDVTPEGQYRFLIVSDSSETFERIRRIFKNNELRAFELNYSNDPWEFQYNEKYRGRESIKLGEFVRYETMQSLPVASIEESPWDKAFAAYVYFRLDDEDQNEFDFTTEGSSQQETASNFSERLQPKEGFLSLSVIGDLTLVSRQRSELNTLQTESGYAPFLSSYFFDIKSANLPKKLEEIADTQWFRRDLNDDQKLAVRKMLNAPDLALVQGPPGTGKTTMIAEATCQFVRQSKKVLLVSQANLAVENVLERLAQTQDVRAIRLGRKEKVDEKNPFSRTLVLGTYYGSIAQTCRSNTLDIWYKSDAHRQVLTKWIEETNLLATDITSLREKEAVINTELQNFKKMLAENAAQSEQAIEQARKREDVEGFLKLLDHDDTWSGHLPESILRTFYDSVVRPLDDLVAVGIRVNRLWPQFNYGQSADKSACAAEILREWRHLLSTVPHLTGDLERLRNADGELVMATEDSIKLEELSRRLQAAQKAMETDASRLSEWQSLHKQIREVKRRGSGLDRTVYEQIFNVTNGEKPAHVSFTDSSVVRSTVVAALEHTLKSIHAVGESVSEGLDLTRKAVKLYLKDLRIVPPDVAQTRRIEGQIRDASARAEEVTNQRRDKEARLRQLMNERAKDDELVGDWTLEKYPQLRDAVKEEQQMIMGQLEQTRAFREAWEPILRQWVSDLTRAETLRSDQNNFLPTYVKACNVVGVTCTENRETLEAAGHRRFDVVIVDEVSKATPPEIIMPLLMGRTAILVGDHRQLPPLFKEQEGSWEEVIAAEEEAVEAGDAGNNTASELTAENFERFRTMVTSSLFKEHFENAPDQLKSFLFTQYRMHPQIMRVVNQFYENRLICGLPDPDALESGSDPRGHRIHGMTLNGSRGQPYLVPDQHVIWLDSTKDPNQKKHCERKEGTSKVNDLEAILIVKTLIDIEDACRLQGYGQGNKEAKQVGVITFYGRQVRNIRSTVSRIQRLRGIQFTAIRYDINTVDRYQGQERPIVVVSMVRNPLGKLSARANTAQFERINVAFSRAQELLVVIGAKEVFCSYPVDLPFLDRPGRRKVEVYRYIIDEINREGGFWQADHIISPSDYEKLLPKESRTIQPSHSFQRARR